MEMNADGERGSAAAGGVGAGIGTGTGTVPELAAETAAVRPKGGHG